MDLLDFLGMFGPEVPGTTSRRRSAQENLVGAVGLWVLPVLNFCIVLFAGLHRHPVVAGAVLPGVSAAACFALCRTLRVSGGWTLVVTLGCLALCIAAGMVALLLGVFASFYSAF